MRVLNTMLGGYFGSRLMTNLREDKGYTYGIGSAMVPLQHSGYFFITCEVGAEVTGEALKEIRKELDLLRSEEVKEEELSLVKNYMLGSFLGH
jgi:predicted Zn-dependent peptidase